MVCSLSGFPMNAAPRSPTTTPLSYFSYVTTAPSGALLSEDELRPFRCLEPGCYQRFKRKFALAEYMKIHTGEKPFICSVPTCRKAFSTTGNLSRHKRLHPWLKPQICLVDGCGRSFSNDTKLEHHLMAHFGGSTPMLPCHVEGCGMSFSTTGNLTRHLKQQHYGYQRCSLSPAAVTVTADAPVQNDIEVGITSFFEVPGSRASKSFNPVMGGEHLISDEELLEFLGGIFDVDSEGDS